MKLSRIILGLIASVIILGGAYFFWHIYSVKSVVLNNVAYSPRTIEVSTSKQINLNNQYLLKVPSSYSYTQITPQITNVPNYEFSQNNSNNFNVIIESYVSSNSSVGGKCAVSTDGNTVYCEGVTITNSFTTQNGKKVFWGTQSDDLSVGNCTMNSTCPPPPTNQRYSITYVFIIPDRAQGTLVEFYASDAVRKASPQVSDFEGVASLLHDTIIPSLNTTQSVSANPSIINVFPSGGSFRENPYPYVVVSWLNNNLPTNVTYSLILISSDGKNIIGTLANGPQCANNLPTTTQSYNWTVQWICVNQQPQPISAGSYKIRVLAYSNNTSPAVSGESNEAFTITSQ